jgi:prevent-host-death family protein
MARPVSSKASRGVVGSRELKARLGKYLRTVRNGNTLTITDRGVPIARLSPLGLPEQGLEAVLDALETEGALSKGSGEPLADLKPLVLRGESIAKTIARDRGDRL